jgi:glycosyltransferase involved in cell wall biosynthesis
MKIAVFNRHFSRRAGGAESYSVSLVEGLAEQHEVHVFAQTIEHSHPKVTYHKVPGPLRRPRWINQLMFATYTWRKTHKPSKDGGFDVIHSHENTWHGQVQTVHVRPIRFHLFEGLTGWRVAMRWLKMPIARWWRYPSCCVSKR